VGLDQAAAVQNTGGTLKFLVFTKAPVQATPPDSARVSVAMKDLGFAEGATVQDLWTGKKVGTFEQNFSPFIRRHASGMYRVSARAKAKTPKS
jgi:hypothetical protein